MAVRPPRGRPPGRHYLRSRSLAQQLVADAGVRPGELVLDIGAGHGVITQALLGAGARACAVELDPRSLDELRRRFGTRVEIVAADATRMRIPREPFRVVANLPFAATSAILRRLLEDPRAPLTQVDAIVEWGFAARRCAVWPSTLTGVYWGAFYELDLVRRIPSACFAPPPSVDTALLRATRRSESLVGDAAGYRAFLRRAFGDVPVERIVGRSIVRAAAHDLGFDPRARGRDLDVRQWAELYLRSASCRRAGSPPARRPSSSRSRRPRPSRS